MHHYRTDLALERTLQPDGQGDGVRVETASHEGMETTWVRIDTPEAARRLGKAQGVYWTLHHEALWQLSPEERLPVACEVAKVLRMLLPTEGDVLVLGLGNRRMTADALGDQVVSGILVTRQLGQAGLRSVCALAPGVMGVTGVETAEFARAVAQQLHPAAIIVVDALAAMETNRIACTVQVTDTGICPGSGVGNHRAAIDRSTMHVPVIAMGVPMVVYASTIVRDTLTAILQQQESPQAAQAMAEALSLQTPEDMVVTPRNIDELVAGLSDLLALAINTALQPSCTMEELAYYLH